MAGIFFGGRINDIPVVCPCKRNRQPDQSNGQVQHKTQVAPVGKTIKQKELEQIADFVRTAYSAQVFIDYYGRDANAKGHGPNKNPIQPLPKLAFAKVEISAESKKATELADQAFYSLCGDLGTWVRNRSNSKTFKPKDAKSFMGSTAMHDRINLFVSFKEFQKYGVLTKTAPFFKG